MKKTFIYVTWQAEGIHCWPEAGKYPEVAFLQHPHRHIFHFRVDVSVTHDDREIEFIMLKRELARKFTAGLIDYKSCEMLADDILLYLQREYGEWRHYRVEVSEDGENGGYVEYDPTS